MQTWQYSIADRLKSKMTALRKGIMRCISIFTLVACAVRANQILVPEIETHPSSLLVPIGTTAVFECKVHHCPQTCSVYWVINGSSTAHDHQQDQYEEQGFIFEDQHNTTTDVLYSKLAITASVSVNSTKFFCIVQDGINLPRGSDRAILIVASGIPLAPNPSIKMMSPNSTIFLLEWSPPFLWPGYHVEHFSIIVRNQKEDRVVHRTIVNASFDDIIVSMTVELDAYSHDMCTCTEFLFTIFPDQVELPPFSIIGRYRSPCGVPDQQLAVPVANINTTVLFTNKVTPILEININLPLLICEHQVVNYSVTTSAINETVDKSNDSINGLYLHVGPGAVSHAITSGLERDKEYSVTVKVWIESQVIESDGVPFNTRFQQQSVFTDCTNHVPTSDAEVFYYELSMGLCLTVVIFILLLLIALLMIKQIHKRFSLIV